MRLPLIRPLLLALTLSLGTTAAMTSHAQTSPAYAIPSDGTLLNVSAQAEASRVPDSGIAPQAPAQQPCAQPAHA